MPDGTRYIESKDGKRKAVVEPVPDFEALEALIKESKYICFYTGAGISAASGVGTFGGVGAMTSILQLREDLLDVKMPTYSHLAIANIINEGKAKFVVTSNHDNMHRRAGTKDEHLAELFGNAYVEVCSKCRTYYQRKVVCPPTGRVCDDANCKGKLLKTDLTFNVGVRYGQATPQEPLDKGFEHSRKADLSIVLGSSMGTAPFCEMPPCAKKMVLVNLTRTRGYRDALVFRMDCDSFMKKAVAIFGTEMKKWSYIQEFDIKYDTQDMENWKILVTGSRPNEPPTCIKEIEIKYSGLIKELDQSNLTKNWETEIRAKENQNIEMNVVFLSEYEVPDLCFSFALTGWTMKITKSLVKEVDYSIA